MKLLDTESPIQVPAIVSAGRRGSCLGGFRTPARAQTTDLRWPASENLHHPSRSAAFSGVPKADIGRESVVGRPWVKNRPTTHPSGQRVRAHRAGAASCRPGVAIPRGRDHASNNARTFVVRSLKVKGFMSRATPLSSLLARTIASLVYPVVSNTFSPGRRWRASSDSWRPFIAPGSPMSVSKRCMFGWRSNISRAAPALGASNAWYPSSRRPSIMYVRIASSSSTTRIDSLPLCSLSTTSSC